MTNAVMDQTAVTRDAQILLEDTSATAELDSFSILMGADAQVSNIAAHFILQLSNS